MKRFAVIMAGGSGERFWPASRRARPKQLLRLTDPDLTMLEEAIDSRFQASATASGTPPGLLSVGRSRRPQAAPMRSDSWVG